MAEASEHKPWPRWSVAEHVEEAERLMRRPTTLTVQMAQMHVDLARVKQQEQLFTLLAQRVKYVDTRSPRW